MYRTNRTANIDNNAQTSNWMLTFVMHVGVFECDKRTQIYQTPNGRKKRKENLNANAAYND